MGIYYILLAIERFRDYGHIGGTLFNIGGFMPVTVVKLVGIPTVIAALILRRPPGAANRQANLIGVLFFAFACYPLLMTVTLGRAVPETALSSMISLGLMLVATRALVSTETSLRNSIRTLVLAAAFSTLWCFRQRLAGEGRVWGVGIDPNYEGICLIMVIPLALWMARQESRRLWRIAGAGSAAALSIATVLTESRGALLALGAVAIAELIRARRRPAALLILLAGFGTLIALAPTSVLQRFQNIKVSGQASNGDDRSTLIRTELLMAGLDMIQEHPIEGVGLEQFRSVSTRYNPALLALGTQGNEAHNTYVQLGAEGGLPMLVFFVVVIFLGFANCRAIRRLQPGSSAAELSGAIRLSLLGYVLAAFFLTAPYIVPFWLMIFLSQNLREIAAAGYRLRVAVEPAATALPPLIQPSRARYA